MKNNHSIVIVFILMLSCKSFVPNKTCIENKEFKTVYFDNIQSIDNHFKEFDQNKFYKDVENFEDAFKLHEKRKESLMSALKFISKYTHVSFESMWNYGNTYPYGIYINDRENWIEWYEENKCNNIQFKISHTIPNAYKN